MPKRFTDKQLLGEQGIALIHQAGSKIGFVWRPLDRNDVGIDGKIEIRDTTTGHMTGLIIKVHPLEYALWKSFKPNRLEPFLSSLTTPKHRNQLMADV